MKNIVLIGMSGVGKTTIGNELSLLTNQRFVDIDEIIVKKTNMEIHDIFSTYGESYFREIETTISKEVSRYEGVIIATGGGVILREDNITNLKRKGIIVLLNANMDTIINNLKRSPTIRPLLINRDLKDRLQSIYSYRKKLYLLAADIIISVDNKSIEKISYEILERCAKISHIKE